jgi:Transglycosylase SLT domain
VSLIFINLISSDKQTAFATKVQSIASQLGIQPNWLMQLMWAESRLKPNAINRYSGASGLIQFMPKTAIGLGTTVEAIRNMDAVQQLDYVYKYFKGAANKMHSYYDVYLETFYPAAKGKPDNWQFPTVVAKQNPAIDTDRDGVMTLADFKKYVRSTVWKSNLAAIFGTLGGASPVIIGLIIATVFFYPFNNK